MDLVALSLTRNGGPNLIDSSVTVAHITATSYLIGGLTGLTAAEGTYILTVDASFIQDSYGNPGSGSASTSWLMDTTPPISSVDPLPAATTSTTFTVSVTGSDPLGSGGSPASGVASYDIYTSTDGGPFALLATVPASSPSMPFTGQVGHSYSFYSVATDLAGNVEPTPLSAQATVRIIAPLTITAVAAVAPDPRTTPVSTIDVTFSEPVDPSTFDDQDLSLTDNGGPNLISSTSAPTVSLLSGSTYRIAGLNPLTKAEGHYALTVNAAGIRDLAGIAGNGTASTS
jgi:hypothetical protein